jgi:hypothetical protein
MEKFIEENGIESKFGRIIVNYIYKSYYPSEEDVYID